MAAKEKIVSFINSYLNVSRISDASRNGIQVDGRDSVRKIAFGVSLSLELIKRSVAKEADMIIVHHGLVWDKPFVVKGPLKEKIELLLKNGISLLAYHLPLDMHPKIGHNAQIMKMLGASRIKPFGEYNKQKIGYRGEFKRPRNLNDIVKILNVRLFSKSIVYRFGPPKIKTLGVISGGAERMFEQAIEEGLNLYITGEVCEQIQETARENKINFISAGHYNSEKPGIWALEKLIKSRFRVKTEFIDIPNPV